MRRHTIPAAGVGGITDLLTSSEKQKKMTLEKLEFFYREFYGLRLELLADRTKRALPRILFGTVLVPAAAAGSLLYEIDDMMMGGIFWDDYRRYSNNPTDHKTDCWKD